MYDVGDHHTGQEMFGKFRMTSFTDPIQFDRRTPLSNGLASERLAYIREAYTEQTGRSLPPVGEIPLYHNETLPELADYVSNYVYPWR